jgi:hypothetical protein
MKKLVLLLLLALLPIQASALSTDDLLALVAMPLAVAAVSHVNGVPQNQLADLVIALNQANVLPTRFVEVIRFVPVALVDQNGQPFVAFVREETVQGITGDALVDAIAQRLQNNFNITPQLALNAPPTEIVLEDNFVPPVVIERVQTIVPNPISFVAMPLAVAAVAEVNGVPANQLANLVAALNQASLPPVQFVEVLRFVPVALVSDNGAQFVEFVQTRVAQGVTGPALAPVIVERLRTDFRVPAQITVNAPPAQMIVVDQNFIPPTVVTRVEEVRTHPHGGPPGQIKKELGLQTGAEVVHGGTKPGRQFETRPRVVTAPPPMASSVPPRAEPERKEHGRGHKEAAPPVVQVPQAAPPVVVAPPANPRGKVEGGPPGQEKGNPPAQGKGKGKGKGKD